MLTFIQISDTHVSENPLSFEADTHDRVQRMMKDINEEYPDAAFIIHTGDIGGFHGEKGGYSNYQEFTSRLRPPVRYVLGNHDDRAAFREVLMDRPPLDAPWHWAFEQSG